MPAANGRAMVIDFDDITIAGVRSRDYKTNRTYVDITTDDDDGSETLLETPGRENTEVTVSGIAKDQRILASLFVARITKSVLSITLPVEDGAKLKGNFLCTSYQGKGDYNGAYEFTATFRSTGRIDHIYGFNLLQENGDKILDEAGNSLLWA